MKDKHTQVRLTKSKGNQNYQYTAWIPDDLAEDGSYVKIKFEDGWEDGWLVSKVYNTLPSSVVFERSQDYKKTRKASDI